MGENKLRIALHSGESMLARRILPQLVAKLAIGLGALFLVGVLLAAIPNHRATVVSSVSAEPGQEEQGMDHTSVPGTEKDEAKSNEQDAGQDLTHGRDVDSAQKHIAAAKAGESTR